MRNNHGASLPVSQPQLTPSEAGSVLVKDPRANHSDRFIHVKKLIELFSQKLMSFLHKTHEPSLTDWISKDEKGQWLVGQLQKTEGTYPPHVIALRDLIHFLSAVSENLDLLNLLLTHSRNGIVGIADFILEQSSTTSRKSFKQELEKQYKDSGVQGIGRALFQEFIIDTNGWQFETDKKIQKLLVSWEKLQKSIGAIKQLPIQNGVIDGALYLYEQLSKYFQGDKGDHLTKVIQVMKDALSSSELLRLKQNGNEELLDGRLFVKAALELDYWKILLATSESQREVALKHATELKKKKEGEPGSITADELALFVKITEFVKSPAWNVQRLSFLERAQQLPEAQNNPERRLTAEKSWLYAMQLKSIIGQIIAVCPEFMAEDNDAGKNMIRMVGTLSRMPTGMIRKINQEWFLQVMEWLGANYHALCQDLELKKIVESIYNIHTNYLADLDELETRLGLKFGLLTHEILQRLGELKPKWVALSGDSYGTTEQFLRDQAEYWKTYLQHQAHFRAQQRIARLVEQEDSLEKKKVIMKDLLKPDFLKEISHLHTLSVAEINALKDKLTAIAKEMPGLSSLGKYIEKKLQEIEAEIAGLFRAYRFGRILFPMRSGLWTQVEARLPSLNSYSDEEKIIRASITATEKELEASLAREDEHLEIVWDTYRASVDKLNPEIITKKLEKDRELCAQIKTLVEKLNNCSLEDLRAQQASKEDRELLDLLEVEREKNLLELEGFLTSSRQKKEEEKEKATQRLKENIQENCGSVKKGGQGLAQSATLRSRFSQMKVQGNRLIASSGPDTERPKQNEPKEENSIEQLQKLIDSVVVPLAKHISDKQFYHPEIADAQWILQLKQVHDLLVKAKMALSEYEKNLTAQAQSQAASVMAYFSAATPYLRLADSLLKLFSQVGDILEGINKLQPRMQQNWFKPLKELLSSAQKLLLNVTDEREPTQEREPLDPAPVSVSQTIKQDIKEFLVELPSNLPGRAELDRDLTALLSMISRVLDSNALTLSGNGLALYNSIEFKRLMDLISKISAVAGSDFVYEKLSNHRALFTKQLSAAIQHVLSEEITMGYRAGVMTAGLYKMAEVLAGRGLIDIPRLYAAQLSYLYAQNSDVVIKDHFAAYIENLLKAFVDKQEEEWVKTLGMLIDEKTGIEIKVSRITSGRSLLPGKDALAEQQGLELRKAQITRLIVAKNREIKFLKRYAAAQHNERTGLSDMYAEQEKVLATLNGIVRHITKVKWDIYNHDPATFDSNINKINQLIVLLEHHIELLAAEDRNPTKLNESVEAIKVDIKKGQKLPPAMQRLFTLALDTFATDQILTTQFSLLAFNEPRSVESEGRSSVSTDEIAGPAQPALGLPQELMKYARDEAARLDVKDEWYRRDIIEHLEIFTEMWSPEKAGNSQIATRRTEILTALQAKNAPNYDFLSHPADVKIVYLLTVLGEHGLGFHKTILSREGINSANTTFSTAQPKIVTLSRKNDNEPVSVEDITSAIDWYRHSYRVYAFFDVGQGGNRFLTPTNISYLKDTAEKYVKKGSPDGKDKLRAIYNALIDKDFEALLIAVHKKTGRGESHAESLGGFESFVKPSIGAHTANQKK